MDFLSIQIEKNLISGIQYLQNSSICMYVWSRTINHFIWFNFTFNFCVICAQKNYPVFTYGVSIKDLKYILTTICRIMFVLKLLRY